MEKSTFRNGFLLTWKTGKKDKTGKAIVKEFISENMMEIERKEAELRSKGYYGFTRSQILF